MARLQGLKPSNPAGLCFLSLLVKAIHSISKHPPRPSQSPHWGPICGHAQSKGLRDEEITLAL